MDFTVSAQTHLTPEELVDEIFDIVNWPGFTGWGPLPGIESAEIINQTAERVGTRFAVTNMDGSTHEETVTEFVTDRLLVMRIDSFSAPLKRFAECFIEKWTFERVGNQTIVKRSFELRHKGLIGKLFLMLISVGLKRAVERHTRKITVSEQLS